MWTTRALALAAQFLVTSTDLLSTAEQNVVSERASVARLSGPKRLLTGGARAGLFEERLADVDDREGQGPSACGFRRDWLCHPKLCRTRRTTKYFATERRSSAAAHVHRRGRGASGNRSRRGATVRTRRCVRDSPGSGTRCIQSRPTVLGV